MAAKAAADLIEGRLDGFVVPLVGVNGVAQAPTDGGAWLIVQYPVTNSALITVGAPGENIWRDEGVARVVINAPAGTGVDQIRTWADQVAALFRGWQSGNLLCRAPAPGPEDDRNDVGAYFQQTIAIPYQFDRLA